MGRNWTNCENTLKYTKKCNWISSKERFVEVQLPVHFEVTYYSVRRVYSRSTSTQ
jgi:hypothetical protein